MNEMKHFIYLINFSTLIKQFNPKSLASKQMSEVIGNDLSKFQQSHQRNFHQPTLLKRPKSK